MTAKQLDELYRKHGGVKRIHTRPYGRGWANTYVCNDGYIRTNTAPEDRALSEFYKHNRECDA